MNNALELQKIYSEANALFKTFRTVLVKQTELADDLKNPTAEDVAKF